MADIAAAAKRNRLLASLPADALRKLLRDLQLRSMHIRDHVLVRDEPIAEVFFPVSCVLSTVAQGAEGQVVARERVGHDEFMLTQEFLAQMLGVRRATVSEVANALQSEGVIRYSRGAITILNPEALAERSCECYGLIQAEYERLFQ